MRNLVTVLVFFLSTQLSTQLGSGKDGKNGKNGRDVMNEQCGACHIESLPSSKKAALEVFNLENQSWMNNLSQSQKKELLNRLKQRVKLDDLELSYLMPRGWKPLPKRPTNNDIELVRKLMLSGEFSVKKFFGKKQL